MIFNIAICDLMIAIGSFFGLPPDESVECAVQSLVINIFQVAQIYWVTILAYYLYEIIKNRDKAPAEHILGTKYLVSWKIYCYGYGIAAFVSSIPLVTVPFGKIEGGWCYFIEPSKHQWTLKLWYIVSLFLWIFAALGFYFYLFWYVYFKLYRQQNADAQITHTAIYKSVNRVLWYPILLTITYMLLLIYLFWIDLQPNAHIDVFGYIAMNMQLLQGVFDCIAFLYTTPKAVAYVKSDIQNLLSMCQHYNLYSARDGSNSSNNSLRRNTDRDRLSTDSDNSIKGFFFMVRKGFALQEMKSESNTDSTSPMHLSNTV